MNIQQDIAQRLAAKDAERPRFQSMQALICERCTLQEYEHVDGFCPQWRLDQLAKRR
jgi:hypothetical protein